MSFARHFRLSLIAFVLLATTIAAAIPAKAEESLSENQQKLAPTYRIYATREGLVGRTTANGHVIKPRDRFVALPSWSVLSPKGTYKFQVRLTYKGRSVVVPVWDVGPWNTRDDYWNPNRRYSDLPVGKPMAEAAYYDGYNGGRDERGRRIGLPNGIDIADGTYWDDLKMVDHDWVDVTFLWLGADPGPGNAVPIDPEPNEEGPAPTPEPEEPIPPVEIEANATAIDNDGAGYTANSGPWFDGRCGLNGTHKWTYAVSDPAKSTNLGTWAPSLPGAGFYEVKAYIPGCRGVEPTNSARYQVTHDGNVTEVVIDQAANKGNWVSLGTYHFGGESSPKVELTDLTGDSRRSVRYDVIAWATRSDTAAPDAKIISITRQDGGFLVKWDADDAMSGAASFDVQVRKRPDGGWTDWKIETSETSAWFGPDEGKHFDFRVRARDWAGNLEPWPETPDMDTTQAQ